MIFWDACAVIYFVEGVSPWAGRLANRLLALDAQYTGHAVSQLSWLECRVKPLREDDVALLRRYEQFFARRDLIDLPVSREIIQEAARLRARLGLRTPDALQAASARSLPEPRVFVTNDAVFKRVPDLDVVLLG